MESMKRRDEFNFENSPSENSKNQTGITSSTKFKHSVLPRKRIHHYGFTFMILSVPSFLSALYFIRIDLIYQKLYTLLNTRFHFARFSFPLCRQPSERNVRSYVVWHSYFLIP